MRKIFFTHADAIVFYNNPVSYIIFFFKLALKEEVGCVTELIESLTDVFEPGVKKKFITYSCETDIQHKYVIGDETKVREIFINIIGNSVKYTPEGGKISVSVKEEPFEKENYIAYRIIVEDNGIWISMSIIS